MSEEEKKAIELLEDIKNNSWTTKYIMSSDSKNADILLNLITKLQKENDILKNHIHYKKCQKCGKEFRTKRNDAKYCNECKKDSNKEWYKNLSEEQREKRREQAKFSMRKLRERRKSL